MLFFYPLKKKNCTALALAKGSGYEARGMQEVEHSRVFNYVIGITSSTSNSSNTIKRRQTHSELQRLGPHHLIMAVNNR